MEKVMESANQKFVRIATRRVNQALDVYRLLSNLKAGGYKSTPDQREKIILALRQGLEELEYHFSGSKLDKTKFSFSLSEDNSKID